MDRALLFPREHSKAPGSAARAAEKLNADTMTLVPLMRSIMLELAALFVAAAILAGPADAQTEPRVIQDEK